MILHNDSDYRQISSGHYAPNTLCTWTVKTSSPIQKDSFLKRGTSTRSNMPTHVIVFDQFFPNEDNCESYIEVKMEFVFKFVACIFYNFNFIYLWLFLQIVLKFKKKTFSETFIQ